MVKPLIGTFDLETSNLNAEFGILLCGVVKPWGGEATLYRIDDYRQTARSDDSGLVKALIEELSHYAILIAHNGVRFDRVFLNTRAIKHGLPVLSPRGNMYDPVQIARRHLRMGYNSLDRLADYLGTEHEKTRLSGSIWVKATIDGDKDALDVIALHCMKDVLVLEEVAQRLVPFLGQVNAWGSA